MPRPLAPVPATGTYVPHFLSCLHVFLWPPNNSSFQAFFWHSVEQYFATLQHWHRLSGTPSNQHSSQDGTSLLKHAPEYARSVVISPFASSATIIA